MFGGLLGGPSWGPLGLLESVFGARRAPMGRLGVMLDLSGAVFEISGALLEPVLARLGGL